MMSQNDFMNRFNILCGGHFHQHFLSLDKNNSHLDTCSNCTLIRAVNC